MRHLGWLHATPEGMKKSRLVSLREQDEDSSLLKLPDLDDAAYLVPLVYEAGLMSSNGMGAIPLSWQEIESWLRTTELDLSVWEKLTIKEMSEVYVSELNQASAKDRAAPFVFVDEEVQINREKVSDKILSVLRSFKRSSPQEGTQEE